MSKIKIGQNGSHVKDLQTRLNKAGARPRLKIDGEFGAKTEAAVKAFQKKHKLKPDGIAGIDTMMVLTGGREGVPEWTLPDPHEIHRHTTAYLREATARHKRDAAAIGLWKTDAKIAELAVRHAELGRDFRRHAKAYMRDLEKLCGFKKAFDKFASQSPGATRDVLKAAARTNRVADRAHTLMGMADLEMTGVMEDYAKLAVKKAA